MEFSSDLKQFLEGSWALDEDIQRIFADAKSPEGHRQVIVLGMCSTSHGHCTAQRILIESGIISSAMAMVRIHYEAVVRSLWYAAGASDEWITKLAQPVDSPDQGEPVLGPPIDTMLERLAVVAPPHVSEALIDIYINHDNR